jgi:hypothetical protein
LLYSGSNKDSSNSTTTQASVVSTTEHSKADGVTTTARATEETAVVNEVEQFEAATALPGPARLQLVTTTVPAVDEDKAAVDVGVKLAGKEKDTSEGRPSIR